MDKVGRNEINLLRQPVRRYMLKHNTPYVLSYYGKEPHTVMFAIYNSNICREFREVVMKQGDTVPISPITDDDEGITIEFWEPANNFSLEVGNVASNWIPNPVDLGTLR